MDEDEQLRALEDEIDISDLHRNIIEDPQCQALMEKSDTLIRSIKECTSSSFPDEESVQEVDPLATGSKEVKRDMALERPTVQGQVSVVRKSDEYSDLENAIIEALKDLNSQLRQPSNAQGRKKLYLQHLTMIHNQRQRQREHGGRLPPPHFEWSTQKILAPSELIEIPQGQVQICVVSAQRYSLSLRIL